MKSSVKVKNYCRLLLHFKESGPQLRLYMGRRWFASKIILIIAATCMLWVDEQVSRAVGFVLLGYLIGMVGTHVQNFLLVKGKWQLQKDFIDWKKVEKYLEVNESTGSAGC